MLLQFIDFCEHLFMHSSSEELNFGIILLSNILVYRGVNAVAAKQTPYCPISGLSLSPPGLWSLLTKCKHVCRCCVNIALHFDIMTLQERMPGYLLWILVVLWTSSSWLCCRTNLGISHLQLDDWLSVWQEATCKSGQAYLRLSINTCSPQGCFSFSIPKAAPQSVNLLKFEDDTES